VKGVSKGVWRTEVSRQALGQNPSLLYIFVVFLKHFNGHKYYKLTKNINSVFQDTL